MIAVSSQVLTDVTKKLREELNPVQIYLFGSFVWGKPRPDSDLDLMIVVDQSKESPARRAFHALKCLRSFDIPKDIIVRTTEEFERNKGLVSALEGRVAREGRLLYDRSKS